MVAAALAPSSCLRRRTVDRPVVGWVWFVPLPDLSSASSWRWYHGRRATNDSVSYRRLDGATERRGARFGTRRGRWRQPDAARHRRRASSSWSMRRPRRSLRRIRAHTGATRLVRLPREVTRSDDWRGCRAGALEMGRYRAPSGLVSADYGARLLVRFRQAGATDRASTTSVVVARYDMNE
jgi:hypothetical protein